MLLVIRNHTFVFMHLFVSVTEQVSWFTAKHSLATSFSLSPVSAICTLAPSKGNFGTAGH